MSVRSVRLLALPLCASIGVLAFTGVPSQGAAPLTSGTSAGAAAGAAAGASHAAADGARKKKHSKHHSKIRNRKLGVPHSYPHSGPSVGQVSVNWSKTHGANRYAVQWSSAPYGKWPGPATFIGPRWLSGSTRTAALDVSGLGAYQASLPYGNPIFMSLIADNSRDKAPRHKARFTPAWPQIATPAAGPHLRVGQYNVDGGNYSADRGTRIASNISSQNLSMVAIQESSQNGQAGSVARDIAGRLGWGGVINDNDQAIIFNSSVVSCSSLGVLAGQAAEGASCSSAGKRFTFVSAHFTGSNANTGAQAQAVANVLPAGTVVFSGDFTSNREPYGSADQAQPVLVRAGFWDSQASLGRIGVNYSTYNGYHQETANGSGQGTRSDYILTRGIQGSFQYHNVANPPQGMPSDHNLVTTEIALS